MPTTKYAFFTFSLPEDIESNKIQLFSSTSETGSYTQVGADNPYIYGMTSYKYENLSETTWYKIRFFNSNTNQLGPMSGAVYGGNFSSNASPDLYVSTSTDGSNYATIQEVLDYATLTTADFTTTIISSCLRRARAIIDYRTAEMNLDRYNASFNSGVSRRKFNAALRIVKEAEICFTLAMAYRAKADDTILSNLRSGDGTIEALTIGSTSITTDTGGSGTKNYAYLTDLSMKFANSGAALLSMLAPSSIFLSCTEKPVTYIAPSGYTY